MSKFQVYTTSEFERDVERYFNNSEKLQLEKFYDELAEKEIWLERFCLMIFQREKNKG